MDNTNELAYRAVLESRLRFINMAVIALHMVCFVAFIVLYSLREIGKIQSLLVVCVPVAVMFAVMTALAVQKKFKSTTLHLPLSAKYKDIAERYYVGKLLIDGKFFGKNVIILIILLMVVMFGIKFVLTA